jgi:hypothetical protein
MYYKKLVIRTKDKKQAPLGLLGSLRGDFDFYDCGKYEIIIQKLKSNRAPIPTFPYGMLGVYCFPVTTSDEDAIELLRKYMIESLKLQIEELQSQTWELRKKIEALQKISVTNIKHE